MTPRPQYLIDDSSTCVATLDVAPNGDHFEGAVSLESTPPDLRRLFDEFEEIVEGQVLSLLDAIEEKIGALPLRVVFDNGAVANVCDLQVFPKTNSVSFKTCHPLPVGTA